MNHVISTIMILYRLHTHVIWQYWISEQWHDTTIMPIHYGSFSFIKKQLILKAWFSKFRYCLIYNKMSINRTLESKNSHFQVVISQKVLIMDNISFSKFSVHLVMRFLKYTIGISLKLARLKCPIKLTWNVKDTYSQ